MASRSELLAVQSVSVSRNRSADWYSRSSASSSTRPTVSTFGSSRSVDRRSSLVRTRKRTAGSRSPTRLTTSSSTSKSRSQEPTNRQTGSAPGSTGGAAPFRGAKWLVSTPCGTVNTRSSPIRSARNAACSAFSATAPSSRRSLRSLGRSARSFSGGW